MKADIPAKKQKKQIRAIYAICFFIFEHHARTHHPGTARSSLFFNCHDRQHFSRNSYSGMKIPKNGILAKQGFK